MATAPLSNLTATWNAGGTTFTAVKMNVTDTASAAGSLLMDLQVGGSSKFKIAKDGTVNVTNDAIFTLNDSVIDQVQILKSSNANYPGDQGFASKFASVFMEMQDDRQVDNLAADKYKIVSGNARVALKRGYAREVSGVGINWTAEVALGATVQDGTADTGETTAHYAYITADPLKTNSHHSMWVRDDLLTTSASGYTNNAVGWSLNIFNPYARAAIGAPYRGLVGMSIIHLATGAGQNFGRTTGNLTDITDSYGFDVGATIGGYAGAKTLASGADVGALVAFDVALSLGGNKSPWNRYGSVNWVSYIGTALEVEKFNKGIRIFGKSVHAPADARGLIVESDGGLVEFQTALTLSSPSASPFLYMTRASSGTNEKVWYNSVGASSMDRGVLTDAFGSAQQFERINRSAASVVGIRWFIGGTEMGGFNSNGFILGAVGTPVSTDTLLKKSTSLLQVRTGTDSGFSAIQGILRSHANAVAETPAATHTIAIQDATGTAYKVLALAV